MSHPFLQVCFHRFSIDQQVCIAPMTHPALLSSRRDSRVLSTVSWHRIHMGEVGRKCRSVVVCFYIQGQWSQMQEQADSQVSKWDYSQVRTSYKARKQSGSLSFGPSHDPLGSTMRIMTVLLSYKRGQSVSFPSHTRRPMSNIRSHMHSRNASQTWSTSRGRVSSWLGRHGRLVTPWDLLS
jgi:hypothetical protein